MSCSAVYLKEWTGGQNSMMTPSELEEAFTEFSQNLSKHAPDGVISVDLDTLNELGLLKQGTIDQVTTQEDLMHYFHVLETADKVTLFNEQFAVWILPKTLKETSITMTFIALLQNNKPHLEIVYMTAGVYNTPKYILKILQHFLAEVQDTEAVISAIGKKQA